MQKRDASPAWASVGMTLRACASSRPISSTKLATLAVRSG